MKKIMIAAALLIGASACASTGAIEGQLVDLGVPKSRAECIADKMGEELDGSDLADVSRFLKELKDSNTAGNSLDALLNMDNPKAAAVAASATVQCTFSR